MIRVNLLPRTTNTVRIFGLALDRELFRTLAPAAASAALAAAAVFALETAAFTRMQRDAGDLAARLAAYAPMRAESRRLALEIARYQEFAREESSVRPSGPAAARTIVRIGNALPPNIWLDAYTSVPGRVELSGSASSIDALGGALSSLERALPDGAASLVNLERRDPGPAGLHFTVHLRPAQDGGAP